MCVGWGDLWPQPCRLFLLWEGIPERYAAWNGDALDLSSKWVQELVRVQTTSLLNQLLTTVGPQSLSAFCLMATSGVAQLLSCLLANYTGLISGE